MAPVSWHNIGKSDEIIFLLNLLHGARHMSFITSITKAKITLMNVTKLGTSNYSTFFLHLPLP